MNRHSDALSATFAALADPTRRAILLRLSQGEVNVSALAEPFHMSLPAVTKHLRVLENAGLVLKGRDAQRRPCRINAAPLKQATDWMAQYRQFWEDSLDRLDAYLQQLQNVDTTQSAVAQTVDTMPGAGTAPSLTTSAKRNARKKGTSANRPSERKAP